MADEPQLLLLPGLGADGRQYGPQAGLPFRVRVVEWPEPVSQSETLAEYGTRIAKSLGPHPNAWVGGISLGAMVALETARALRARGVILIGGCTSHRQIATLFKLTLAAAALLPDWIIHQSLRVTPAAMKLFEQLTPEQRDLMTRMVREHSPRQIRWSCRALSRWDCCATPVNVPIRAIHGADDEVIPLKNVHPDEVVPGGRHLISMSHPEQVNRFLTETVLGSHAPENSGRAALPSGSAPGGSAPGGAAAAERQDWR